MAEQKKNLLNLILIRKLSALAMDVLSKNVLSDISFTKSWSLRLYNTFKTIAIEQVTPSWFI